MDARSRRADDARPSRSRGSPAPGPSPGAREGAFGDHERGDRRSDGSVHAEERVGRDQGAGRGVALERAKSGPVSMCRACGVTATQSDPVRCTVCGATDFEVISREMIEKIAAVEEVSRRRPPTTAASSAGRRMPGKASGP